MPIRLRLTLWFTAILCVILLLSGVVLNGLLSNYLYQSVDNTLTEYSARVHGTLHNDNPPVPLDYNVIHSKLPAVNDFASPGIYIQIIDADGRVVVKSDNFGEQELPVDPVLIEKGLAGNIVINNVAAGGNTRVRIIVSPLYLGNQTLLLEVAQSLNFVDATISQARWATAAAVLVSLVLTSLLGNLLVRRVLSPVENITRTAQEIEGNSDLTRRVDYHGPSDEIGRLATTFDHMLDRLNRVFESQKQFVADASHELRTPLTVIQGNIDLLKRNLNDRDREESLAAIKSESQRMTRIVNDLLLLAEIESGRTGQTAEINLKDIVTEEYRRVNRLELKRKIVLGRTDDITVKGDAYRLNQLLGNLVNNAIKYTSEGGTITLSLFKAGDWARLEVKDTGIGISPDDLSHLFERFYRVDKSRSRAGGGTGLGLAIVKSIAEQHGGKVTVESELGKGSSFTAWLKI